MGKMIFRSNRSMFQSRNEAFKDLLQANISMDIEVHIKTAGIMPVKTGGMKSEVRSFKNENGGYRVEAGKEYSAVQEAGRRMSGRGAPTEVFKNYSTSGTGPHWFSKAIDATLRNKRSYIEEARKALGL